MTNEKGNASAGTRSVDLTLVQEWNDGQTRRFQDYLVGEEPLEIRLGEQLVTVTMRTPGQDLELAAGFLFSEGLMQRREEIASIDYAQNCKETERGNVVEVERAGAVSIDLERTQRHFFAMSSCGICGKTAVDSVRVRGAGPLNPDLRADAEVLCRLPERLRESQAIFGRTGGLHAAGLFDTRGQLVTQREDVGRHNAVDKIIGWALLSARLPLSEYIMMVSGRGGFEIIQKAIVAGIPLVACVSAPSSLAVRLARQLGLTLIGFLRGRRFIVYAGEERVSWARLAEPARGR